jgi:cell division protein FtsW (lipid II flippase)
MKTASPWDRRRPERELLLICLGGIGLGFILVMGSLRGVGTPLGLAHLLPFLLYALSLAGLHLALVMAGFRGDQILVVAVAFLTGFGLLAQTRLGAFAMGGGESGLSDYAFVGGLVILLAIALGFMSGRYRTLAEGHWVWVWAGISLLLVLVVLVTGQRFRGAVFGAGLITPTELLKVSFVLFAAAYIDRQAKALGVWAFHGLIPPWRPLAPLVGVWVALVLLLLVQRDLGMVMMLGLILPILLTLGTGRWGYMGLGLGGAGLLGWLLLAVFQHGERRIQAWLAPFHDPTGDSWQVLQGLSGMYAGGLWGEGFGAGNPEYTPIAESDFIYAVIGEELGFVGTALVMTFFLLLFLCGLRIAYRSRTTFGLLLASGLTTVLAAQTFLNIGGVTNFIPLTGITLPFISQGGSSLLTAFAILGLLLAISDGEASGTRARAPRPASAKAPKRPRPAGVPAASPHLGHSDPPPPGRAPGLGRRRRGGPPAAASPDWSRDDRD